MNKKYKIRHAILVHLFNKMSYDKLNMPCLKTSRSSLDEIARMTGYNYDEVWTAHHGIPEDLAFCTCEVKNEHCMELAIDGIAAAIDNYWIRQGEIELNERIYDKTKWIAPIATLIIAIASLIYTILSISHTQKKLILLEKEILQLKQQKN